MPSGGRIQEAIRRVNRPRCAAAPRTGIIRRPLMPERRILLPFRPYPHVSILDNLDVNDVRAAADRTILNVRLARSCRQVDGYYDLLPAGIAVVAGFILHRRPPPVFVPLVPPSGSAP